MNQSKCRRGNPLVQLHTRPVISPSCESAASQYRVGLLRFESGRVLVFQGGVFGCSSRMNGKPSSPVLRGLGASNGARLLDPNLVTPDCPSSWHYPPTWPSGSRLRFADYPRKLEHQRESCR